MMFSSYLFIEVQRWQLSKHEVLEIFNLIRKKYILLVMISCFKPAINLLIICDLNKKGTWHITWLINKHTENVDDEFFMCAKFWFTVPDHNLS